MKKLIVLLLCIAGCGSNIIDDIQWAADSGIQSNISPALFCAIDADCGGSCAACVGGSCTTLSAGLLCRSGAKTAGDPSTGEISSAICDPAEVCDGINPTCPSDVIMPAGTVCGFGRGPCDPNTVICSSRGTCEAHLPAGEICNYINTICNPQDICDGVRSLCPAKYALPGTICGVGKTCGYLGICH